MVPWSDFGSLLYCFNAQNGPVFPTHQRLTTTGGYKHKGPGVCRKTSQRRESHGR